MIYKVDIADRELVFYDEIRKPLNLSWDYNLIGGCGAFSFSAFSKYCTDIIFGANFNIKIYRRNPSTKNFDLWYQGRIEDKEYNISAQEEIVTISGFGYQSALNDILINQNYDDMEISDIVKDILDNFIVPNTRITYDDADIEVTGVIVDSLDFNNVKAGDALRTLSEAVGSREWGVDRNRKFFFKAWSSTIGFNYALGRKIRNLKVNNSTRNMANRIIVQGGDIAGVPFEFTKDYTFSQTKYQRRDLILQRTSVVTDQVAEAIADAAYAEKSDVSNRVRCDLLDEVLIENTVPVGLFNIKTREFLYDESKYDSILYAGLEPVRVNRAKYSIDKSSNLLIGLELGQVLPSEVEMIKQLEFKTDQLRQAR